MGMTFKCARCGEDAELLEGMKNLVCPKCRSLILDTKDVQEFRETNPVKEGGVLKEPSPSPEGEKVSEEVPPLGIHVSEDLGFGEKVGG